MSKIKKLIKDLSPLNNRSGMPVGLYVIKVIIIFWFVKFGTELIGEGLALGLHFVCGKNPFRGELFDAGTITLITYFGYGLMIVIMVCYWKLFQKKTVSQLGFTGKAGTYFAGAAAGVLLSFVSVALIVLTGTITYNGVFDSIDGIFIVQMLAAFIFQGTMEEVLCRGIVLGMLKDKTPPVVSVGISTLLFIIPHLDSVMGESGEIVLFAIANLIVISLIFSFFTLRFKSLWAACGFHSAWNFTVFNVLGLNLSGNDEMSGAIFNMQSVGSNFLNGGAYGIEASGVTAAVLIVFLLFAMGLVTKNSGEGRIKYGV